MLESQFESVESLLFPEPVLELLDSTLSESVFESRELESFWESESSTEDFLIASFLFTEFFYLHKFFIICS
jgi:hypothetical protein